MNKIHRNQKLIVVLFIRIFEFKSLRMCVVYVDSWLLTTSASSANILNHINNTFARGALFYVVFSI